MSGTSPEASEAKPSPVRLNRWVRTGRWSMAILVALLVHGAALFLIDLPDDAQADRPSPQAGVSFLSVNREGQDQLLKEQLEFSDTAPLYFPTHWNVGNAENIRLPLKSPGDIFESYPARLAFSGVSAGGLVSLPRAEINTPPDVLESFQPDFTRVAGRVDRMVMPLAPRLATVEIFNLSDGRKVYETTISGQESAVSLGQEDWRPAEWVVLLNAVGTVGEAMMTRSSGSDTVDDTLQRMVDGQLDLDKQLAPGYYTVLVGP